MNSTKSALLYNPKAGSAGQLESIRDGFQGEIVELGERDTKVVVRELRRNGIETFIVAGGDGTLNAFVNAVAPDFRGIRVGILPAGTGNDFARSLECNESMEHALNVVQQGKTKKVDIIKVTVGERCKYLINASALGFGPLVHEKMTSGVKESLGPVAYLLGAVKALPEVTSYKVCLTLNGTESFCSDVYNMVVSNGKTIAGGTEVAPHALVDDGEMDLILFPALPLGKLALAVSQVFFGTHIESDHVIVKKARTLHLESEPPIQLNVDGEMAGESPVTFEVIPGVLEVFALSE